MKENDVGKKTVGPSDTTQTNGTVPRKVTAKRNEAESNVILQCAYCRL